MNNYDKFFETLHKNSVKRRRMFSLLLVLSLFTTSGVVWLLRGIGITMTDDPVCLLTEHVHSDQCYASELVCGLEENDEHSHSDQCYQNVLICDIPEHSHSPQCFSELPIDESDIQADEAIPVVNFSSDESSQDTQDNNDDISVDEVATESADAPDNEEPAEVGVADDLPALSMGRQFSALADGNDDPPVNPGTVPTIDNIARGIKFTLFDYGDNDLEAETNNYGTEYTNKDEKWKWRHTHWKNSGINTGKNPEEDILFFAYGTPAYNGTPSDDDDGPYTGEDGKTHNRDYNIYSRLEPDKNNYSGDYNSSTKFNLSPISGNRPVQGIVKNTLEDGFPVLSGSDKSLDYLFNENETEYKKVYNGVNHFLQEEMRNGVSYLVYDSNKNYAYFDTDTRNFNIYGNTFRIINDNHHRGSDIDPKTENPYNAAEGGGDVDPNFMIGFFPFDQYNIEKRDPNYNTQNSPYNHHFGMTMEADFINTPNPSKPVTFKYSGDDDMWVFVDNKLALDLGGIHEPASGMIDFTNGLVWTQDNRKGDLLEAEESDHTSIKEQVKGLLRINDDQWNALEKPIGNNTSDTTVDSQNRWIVQTLSSVLGDGWDNTESNSHSIKMFYLERGGCYSNLAMEINLPTVKPLSILKKVDKGSNPENYYDNDNYSFKVLEKNGDTFVDADLGNDNNGQKISNVFTIKAGERMDFKNLDSNRIFKVVEVGVDPKKYSGVSINGATNDLSDPNGEILDIESSDNALSLVNTYTFNNIIRTEYTNLSVNKEWEGGSHNKDSDYKVQFKIYRTDLSVENSQPTLVAINGKRTFILDKSNNWTWTKPANVTLPSRFGEHVYSYSVVEQNTPIGYNASYSKDDNGNITITNTIKDNTQINVKKDWHNGSEAVKLLLKRKYVEYTDSEEANLTVNLYDEGNNLIKSLQPGFKVYQGGSVEFSLNLPNGVKLYQTYNTQTGLHKAMKFNGNESDISEENGIFELSNLAENNVAEIHLTSGDAEDSLMLLHHSFTKDPNGWFSNATEKTYIDGEGTTQNKMVTSGAYKYAKNDGLLVRQRHAPWEGAKLILDPAVFKPKKTYTFSTYVFYDPKSDNKNNPDSTTFVLTYNDGLEKGNDSYHQIAAKTVNKGEWVQLSGSVTFPADINPYGMFLIVETRQSNWKDNGSVEFKGPFAFRMDEFVAVEGAQPISVSQQTDTSNPEGIVTIGFEPGGGSNSVMYNENLYSDHSKWSKNNGNNNTTVTPEEDKKNKLRYVVISNRDNTSDGISMSASDLVPGRTYHFHAKVQGHGETGSEVAQLSINTINKPTDGGQYSNYVPIGSASLWDGNNKYYINNIEVDYTIPFYAKQDEMYLYFETPANSDQTGDFRVYELIITDVTPGATVDKPGYSIINNKYVSNYDEYNVSFNPASATNPLKLNGNYTDDYNADGKVWCKEITLDSSNNWIYQWNKEMLGEESNKLYQYWIEEPDYDGNSDYIVDISGNHVATNTQDNPIVVSNTYIWYTLPATGGDGSLRFYLAAAVLISISLFSAIALIRRERRSG